MNYSENMRREAQRILETHVADPVGNCAACWLDDKVVVFGKCAPRILAEKILEQPATTLGQGLRGP